MAPILYLAAFLLFAIVIVHTVLGEKYILVRLFRRDDLPRLFGSADFTIRTLRFAWHLTSVAWWGFAALLVLLAHPPLDPRQVGAVIGCTFLVHFLIALAGTRGRHLSWIVLLGVGIAAFYATRI